MKKKITTEKVLEVYRVLSDAKFSKLDGADQTKIVKILLALEPPAKDFETATKTAADKLKEAFPDYDDKAQKAAQYQTMPQDKNADMSEAPMGAAEYHQFMNGEYAELNKRVKAAVEDLGNKEVEVEFEPITEDLMQQISESNKTTWTFAHAKVLTTICSIN